MNKPYKNKSINAGCHPSGKKSPLERRRESFDAVKCEDIDPGGIAVVGAGPAGMFAAIFASANGAKVTLYEPNPMLGKKLRITGKGRCNVTNDCTPDEFLKNVTKNHKFLYGAVNRFSPEDAKAFFEDIGVPLKTERGRRVFPVSYSAKDVADALARKVRDSGVTLRREKVTSLIIADGEAKGVKTPFGKRFHSAVIVATGGLSYPLTGSDGDGFRFAEECGLEVTDPIPSLVPLVTKENFAPMSGLTLKNVVLTVKEKDSGKTVFSGLGEMLFTHFGVSGPLVLSASSHMTSRAVTDYVMYVDLKPALDYAQLDARVLSDFAKYSQRDFVNSLGDLLPQKLIGYIISESGIPERTKVNSLTKEMRHVFVSLLKALPITPTGTRPIAEAIVTSGGVNVKELSPKTMESKKIPRLYFAGEVIDVDAYTGGYNLQIAYSTGYLAGMSAAEDYGFEDKTE